MKSMKFLLLRILFCIPLFGYNQSKPVRESISLSNKKIAGSDLPRTWKFGVALYTFHTFSFTGALAKVDSSGVEYIEGFAFQKAGSEWKDSLIMNLSSTGIEKLYQLTNTAGFKMESIYIFAGKTIDSWKKQFDIARQLHVKFVTAEPPVDMWDSIDSLAGVYKIKVAIHEHWKGMSAYWHPDSVLAALKNHPNFGVCADLGHWPKSGINPVDALKKLGGHIIAIHLKDIAEYNNTKIQDVPVGTGVIDFPGVFKELKRQKFDGYIYIERDAEDKPDNLPSLMATVKYYNEQLGLPQVRKKSFANMYANNPGVAETGLPKPIVKDELSTFREYNGSFKMPENSQASVVKMISKGADLYMQPGDYPEMKLTFLQKDQFEEPDNNIQVVFVRTNGLITEVKLTYQGKESVGKKEAVE